MRLSEFFLSDMVLRDAEFDLLALSNSVVSGRALSFLDDARFTAELFANPAIRAVICRRKDVSALPDHIDGIVLSDDPRWTYFSLHNRLCQSPDYCPPLSPSVIPASCTVSPLSYIAPTGVELGEGVVVEEFVSIKGPCRIGAGTVIYAGAKIGGVGYETKYRAEQAMDIVHCGSVEIGENVILWENVTVHRALYPWDTTSIGSGSRIGAQSHIDHGVRIGRCVKVCAGCVVSGRTEIADHAFVGPGSVVSNRMHIGENAIVRLGSVVTKEVPAGASVSGNFAIAHPAHIQAVKQQAEGEK